MEHELGSHQYVRHRMMLEIYHDARRVRESIIKRAGVPLTCASQLGRIHQMPHLAQYIDAQIQRLTKRVEDVIEMSPPYSVSTTIKNALPDLFSALWVPGMPLHNNYTDQTIRDKVVVDRRRIAYPDMTGARDFSVMRTVSATCKKNGTRIYRAVIEMAKNSAWSIFNSGIPPPIFYTMEKCGATVRGYG